MMPPEEQSETRQENVELEPGTGMAAENDDERNPNAPALAEWEPKKVPAQVRIVQILSDLLRPPFMPRKRQLVVILSAWDVVESTKLSPPGWMSANMPLVDQFLRTNDDSFSLKIYGVSAQGVSLDDSKAVGQAAKLTPSHRISIIGPSQSGHDITEPLAWLISAK
jgi:hypothetical protein